MLLSIPTTAQRSDQDPCSSLALKATLPPLYVRGEFLPFILIALSINWKEPLAPLALPFASRWNCAVAPLILIETDFPFGLNGDGRAVRIPCNETESLPVALYFI